jgi:hypothetical protein
MNPSLPRRAEAEAAWPLGGVGSGRPAAGAGGRARPLGRRRPTAGAVAGCVRHRRAREGVAGPDSGEVRPLGRGRPASRRRGPCLVLPCSFVCVDVYRC